MSDQIMRLNARFIVWLSGACLLPMICFGQGGAAPKDWQVDLSMYVLTAGLSGNATIRGVTADVDVPFSKIWDNLQFSAMGRSTVRYRRWGFSTDLIYMGLGAANNGFDVGFDQWMVQPVVEYQVASWMSPYAGARYSRLTGEVRGPNLRSGSSTQSWWDPVVGAELRLPSTSKIRLRVRGDVGGFGAASSFTGQIEPMLDWRASRRMSFQIGYRFLYADYKSGEGRNLFRYDMLTRGPQIGATLHF